MLDSSNEHVFLYPDGLSRFSVPLRLRPQLSDVDNPTASETHRTDERLSTDRAPRSNATRRRPTATLKQAPAKAGENLSAGELRSPLSRYGSAFAPDSTPLGGCTPRIAHAIRLPLLMLTKK